MKKLMLTLVVMGMCLWVRNSFAEGVDEYTKLLLHNDDASFADSSPSNRSVTNNNVKLDTTQKKFGTASGFFNGTDAYLSLSDSADWDFGSEDFTVDFQIRFNAAPANHNGIVGQFTDTTHYWDMYWYGSGASPDLYLESYDNGVASSIYFNWQPSTNVWYHVATVRNGTTWHAFIDGVSQEVLSTAAKPTLYDVAAALTVGYGQWTTTAHPYGMNGWIDEFRVSKGIARWTSDFTPPSEPYSVTPVVPEPSTMFLLGIGTLAMTALKRKKKLA